MLVGGGPPHEEAIANPFSDLSSLDRNVEAMKEGGDTTNQVAGTGSDQAEPPGQASCHNNSSGLVAYL